MKKTSSFLIKFWKTHRVWSVVALVILVSGFYYTYGKITSTAGETSYILSTVQKGTVITTVSATGQVSSSNEVSLKPKASGDLLYLGVVNGQDVKKGDLIARLDTTDALKSVRDAEASLRSAQITYEKLVAPADALSVLQAENSVTQAEQAKVNAEENLVQSYDNAFNTISNAFLDLPSLMQGLDGVLHNYDLRNYSENVYSYADSINTYKTEVMQYRDDAISKFDKAKTAYDKNFINFKNIDRNSDKTVIESLLNETYLTIKATADSVKSMNNLIDLYKDVFTEQKMNIPSIVSTHVGSLNSYTSKTNSHLSNLLSQVNSIKNYKDSIFNNTRSLQEKNESLKNLKEGPDALDIESSKLSLTQKENALLDAKNNLSNYYVYAPFDGKIASVPVSKFDSISSGSAIATLITAQQQADISLNEIDASKIKLGQKATMTFDAIDELVITGTVSELDTVGTVSQGVVTYKASILFDIKDERIKSGMSVSASIVIDKKLDVLTIPNSAIKTSGNNNYVEILTGATSPASSGQGVISGTVPEQKNVVVGLSNDSITEVVSGLKEGDQIISRSIKPTTTTATPSITSLMGGNRAAGGTARATTGR